ncbi:hypothetical protein BVX93_02105 [bacterium B13(2017)]|nr:hypothetical protein BVX93_02105 [bacterium B13(2017)]
MMLSLRKNNSEKRQFKRYPFNCYIRTQSMRDADWIDAFTENLSFGGLVFVSQDKYEHKRIIDLQFHDVDILEDLHCFKTEVMWSKPYRNSDYFLTGVKFEDLQLDQQVYVRNTIMNCYEAIQLIYDN